MEGFDGYDWFLFGTVSALTLVLCAALVVWAAHKLYDTLKRRSMLTYRVTALGYYADVMADGFAAAAHDGVSVIDTALRKAGEPPVDTPRRNKFRMEVTLLEDVGVEEYEP